MMKKKVMAVFLCHVFLCAEVWAVESQDIDLFEALVFTPALNVTERYEDNFRVVEGRRQFALRSFFSPALALNASEYDRVSGVGALRAQCANSPGAIGCFWSP